MKVLSIALILGAAFADQTVAHYRLFKFINNGSVGDEYAGIRRNSNYDSPINSVYTTDLRCNVGTQASASSTATIAVTAGSIIGFQLDGPASHPGPFNIYMAKTPGAASAWSGSGAEWFRVWEKGTVRSYPDTIFDTTLTTITFTLPKSIPNGEYLVRGEHIALHQAYFYGGAQFYISCAQINVTGGGSGSPSPKVAIPGVYTGREPGILIGTIFPTPLPPKYIVPGPPIWRG